jgi:hypothetical protein
MAGLSKSRLERMHQVLSRHVQREEISGLAALVSHHDDVHVEAIGTLAFTDFWTLAYMAQWNRQNTQPGECQRQVTCKTCGPPMILKQYYLGCLAQASYLLGDECCPQAWVGECIVARFGLK